jgi:hypothetical protein
MQLAEAERLRVTTEQEEQPGKHSGLDDGAWNGAEWVACLVAQCGGGLEANEAEQREHDSKPHAGRSDLVQRKLRLVDVEAVVDEQDEQDNQNHGHGRSLDPQHQARGGLDIAVSEVRRSDRCNDREQRAGKRVAGDGRQQDVRIVEETADHGGTGSRVCKQQGPTGRTSPERRQQRSGELVERAWRCRGSRETCNAERDQ